MRHIPWDEKVKVDVSKYIHTHSSFDAGIIFITDLYVLFFWYVAKMTGLKR